MSIKLVNFFADKINQQFIDAYLKNKLDTISGAGNSTAKAFIVSDLFRTITENGANHGHTIWVVNDVQEKNKMAKNLRLWSHLPVFEFNSGNESDENKSLIQTYCRIQENDQSVTLFTYSEFLSKTPDPNRLNLEKLKYSVGDQISLVRIFQELISAGYKVCEDKTIKPGEYHCQGSVLTVFPVNTEEAYRLEVDFDEITSIVSLYPDQKKTGPEQKNIKVYPLLPVSKDHNFFSVLTPETLVIEDEIGVIDDFFSEWEVTMKSIKAKHLQITTFAEDSDKHQHLHYTSVINYQNIQDFINDLKIKKHQEWQYVIITRQADELIPILKEKHVVFTEKLQDFEKGNNQLLVLNYEAGVFLPEGFQNADHRIAFLTDKEICLTETKKGASNQKNVFLDFLTSLKTTDLVVHADHGIARFGGLVKRTISEITREYLQLNYAQNDKLFVPIDQADKVSKYIGAEETAPKLTRLGSAEWVTVTKKVKLETQKIAKELLQLYASRHKASGFAFKPDNQAQKLFEAQFPYEETPGQIKAINDVKADMEKAAPMDRLVCGDVGFGKTEVAIRAAFKAVQDGKQVAFISPITILADQHYKALLKRVENFDVRVEMLSRFRSQSEQTKIVKQLERGEVDIIVGTHRLLQSDINFKDLGLVIIDEEQRFGVKQKEKLKEMRTEVDVLTLTATPIPRTLNLSLNKLRDITTITTPPPGRLPIITEVRKFSYSLIREAIMRELERDGQVYFLHNRVQTIEAVAEKLRQIVPEARFVVAHGKLSPEELEKRILAFKDGEFDVLVSSTIIENGIDLANANTLIVNKVEQFGLSQLYQLRGRVGRGRQQAYAYFMYHGQRLRLDAKKRLKAIVEATELGAGFQIAMKDLEIRGAGDILGASQHGAINTVGVSHFMRMLQQAVDDLKTGRKVYNNQPREVSIELPINAFIPDSYIVNTKDKINVYQKMSSADSFEYLNEIKEELSHDYGKPPIEVLNLFQVIELKILAKKAHITNVKVENIHSQTNKELILTMSDDIRPENIMMLLEYNQKWIISGTKLKIRFSELGMKWIEELKVSLEKLSQVKKVESKKSTGTKP